MVHDAYRALIKRGQPTANVAMKAGDKVKSRFAAPDDAPGEIDLLTVPGMPDCALVRYPGSMDGMCVPRRDLVVQKK